MLIVLPKELRAVEYALVISTCQFSLLKFITKTVLWIVVDKQL